MKACRLARKHLWSCLERGAGGGRVADHLRECPECAAELRRLREEMERLRGAAPEVAPPDPDVVWARIEARLPRRTRWRHWALAPVAPAVLVLAVWLAQGAGRERMTLRHLPDARESAGVQGDGARVGVRRAGSARTKERIVAVAAPARAGRIGRQDAPSSERPRMRARRPHRKRVVAPAAPLAPVQQVEVAAAKAGASGAAPREVFAQVARMDGGPAEQRQEVVEAGGGADERPASAVVVTAARPGSGMDAGAGVSFCRLETTDPVLGTTSRLVVTRETDETGRTRLVTIDYEGGLRPQGG